MTQQEIVEYIKENGKNGELEINVYTTEDVTERKEIGGEEITEEHDFVYTKIILVKEDVTKLIEQADAIKAKYNK